MTKASKDVIANMQTNKLPVNISTGYRHHHPMEAQSRGAVIKTVCLPGNVEVGVHQLITVKNECDDVIRRALESFKAAAPGIDDPWTTMWSGAKGWPVLEDLMSRSQLFPDYRHLIPYLKKGCTPQSRTLLEAWLRTCSTPKAQAYMQELERQPGAKGKLNGKAVVEKYVNGGGGDHQKVGALRLLDRGKAANALAHGPPLGNTSSKAEQQNAADLRNGVRKTAVVSSLHTFGKMQDARLSDYWAEAKASEDDPAAALPKYGKKMARATEQVNGMVVDSVTRSGDAGSEKVEVANTRTESRTTHIVDMKVLNALSLATTATGEINCGDPCSDGVFSASGLHSAYTLKAAEHLNVSAPPPVWWRQSTARVQVFDNQPPAQIQVALGAILEGAGAVAHPERQVLFDKKTAGRPHMHKRIPGAGEKPSASTAKPTRVRLCSTCNFP